MALTPPPSFGHLWGNFLLSRLRKKHTTKKDLKTTLKIPINYLRITPKLLEWVQPPPSSIENVHKKAKKKLPQNFFILVGPTPPPFWKISKRKKLFFVIISLVGGGSVINGAYPV